jgi:hypothetical protein
MDHTPFIAVVSDTHGFYDSVLDDLFAGAAHIIHAGDIGPGVVDRLQRLAPVTAVLGNTDMADLLPGVGEEAEAEVLGLRLLVGHIRERLLAHRDPEAEGFDIVVTGHSHKPMLERRAGTLYINPGSAGHARFGLPRTVAIVTTDAGRPQARIVPLS